MTASVRHAEGSSVLETAHRVAVGGLALMIGLFEGPAQIVLLVVLATTAATGRLRGYRPGAIEAGVGLWFAVGYLGLLETETARASSAGALAPLHALALIVGARALQGLRVERYAALALAGVGVNAAYGLLQVFVIDLPLEVLMTTHVRDVQLQDPDAPHRLTMARGLFYNRLKLAHVGVVGAALGLLLTAHRALGARARAFAALGTGVILLGVLLTYRRAAPLALGLGGMALLAVRGRARAVAGIAAGGGLLVLALGSSAVGQRRLAAFDEDWQDRQRLFEAGVEVWRLQPVIGVGHGDYPGVVGPFLPAGDHELPSSSPHNQALKTLAETGVLGTLGLFGALGCALWTLGLRLRRRSDPTEALALVTLVTLAALGGVHAVLHHPNVAILWWLAMGVAAAARSDVESTT